jgi:hypothetical protein
LALQAREKIGAVASWRLLIIWNSCRLRRENTSHERGKGQNLMESRHILFSDLDVVDVV